MPTESFASDVGTLSDEDVSMTESLTEVQSSTADAPPKIPLTGNSIRERLLQVIILKCSTKMFKRNKIKKTVVININQ